MTGRPAGPIRKYTVEQIWPHSPGRWRQCVFHADEPTARRSATAVLRLKYALRIRIDFLKPGTENRVVAQIIAAEYDPSGRAVTLYEGPMAEFTPDWVTNLAPAEVVSS